MQIRLRYFKYTFYSVKLLQKIRHRIANYNMHIILFIIPIYAIGITAF